MNEGIKEILRKPIQYLKGVGEARARLFNRLGIFTIDDLIKYYPRDYEDRGNLKKIIQLADGESCAFQGVIATAVTESRPRKGLSIYKLLIKDETGAIIATWFNQHYLKNIFKVGESYVFYGKISRKFRSFEVQSPVFEKVNKDGMKNTCRIVPVYPSTAALSQNIFRAAVSNALVLVSGKLEDALPIHIRTNYKLCEINYCVSNIHFPATVEDFNNSRFRLAFEELFILQLGLLSIKNSLQQEKEGIKFKPVDEVRQFIEELPFKLTSAQKKVFGEIEADMESNKVMNRLVQGDVGSGKTIVAVLALFKAVKNGYQGTLMVPTEILAEQHFKSIAPLLEQYGIKTALLTGGQSKKQKEHILQQIKNGCIDAVIGTHALIEDNVQFEKLGLVITDEQHRFGVRQRAKLSKKGDNPDVIVMTATPIPRTLALILYGDLDISIIDELPPGRKPVKTYIAESSMRDRVNNFIRKKVGEGRQVYIICPLVEASEEVDAKSAMETAKRIAAKDFRDLKVGLIHGKMKHKEKEEVMREFVEGRIDILVSTTVIEVGVNVPNSTLMVIENAERFGLAQLHQLRGRVGRGEHQSYCILYNESQSDISRQRMQVMEKTNDGFVISEKDLELRGPGEFFGTRQHGIPELKIANLYKDMDILKTAQKAALELLEQDPLMERPENKKLKDLIFQHFKDKLKHLSLN
ncbi:MAG: ATP-dependent DNA helicase RecG [Clostridia bacterium]|nr:ATP-dependent DNA helicase RecG [Clostridia bacterium]